MFGFKPALRRRNGLEYMMGLGFRQRLGIRQGLGLWRGLGFGQGLRLFLGYGSARVRVQAGVGARPASWGRHG